MIDIKDKKKSFFIKYPVETIFTAAYFILSLKLNLQFLDGSNINTKIAGHDEYIAVKEVYSILSPLSWKHFFLALIAGDVIFYGRIMFYLDAAFAWIPFKIWGIEGMVYAIRLVHSVFLIAALLLLANTFLKERFHKTLFLMGSGALFYSLYFVMMPKPEPMQLFFLASFLFYFKRSNWSFGIFFILLGIAFGLKFNVLPILPIIFLLPILKKSDPVWNKNLIKALKSFAFFIAGLIIAIPCLLFSPIKPIYIQTYIHETFHGTGKSYDNPSLTFFNWLKDGFGGYYLGHWIMGFVFLVFIILAIFLQFKKIKYSKDFSSFLLLILGLVMTVTIMYSAKRLWPHYLWTGFILMLLGLILFAAQQTSMKQRKIYLSAISVITFISFFFFLTRDLPMYTSLDKNQIVIKDAAESKIAINYIRHRYPGSNVATDGSLLFLFSDFVKANPYHPFASELPKSDQTIFLWYADHPDSIWGSPNDLVVFYKRHPMHPASGTSNNFSNEKLKEIYMAQTQTNFLRDTALGEVVIYKRKDR